MMIAKTRLLRQIGLFVLAVLPTISGQSCVSESECVGNFCCTDAGQCSDLEKDSVLPGGAANDDCECLYNAISAGGICECRFDGQCPDNLCCGDDGQCSTRDKDSVLPGGDADDVCECAFNEINGDGVCGCRFDGNCSDNTCCMENGQCSVNEKDSLQPGDPAEDVCECAINSISADNICECNFDSNCSDNKCCMEDGQCSSNDKDSLPLGATANDVCECAINGITADNVCACNFDSNCSDNKCCMEDGLCSSNDKDSLPQGATANDVCECVINSIIAGNICGCNFDSNCPDDTCCREDGQCSTLVKDSVQPGGAADDVCECAFNAISDNSICECRFDNDCLDDKCCTESGQCSTLEKDSMLPGEAANDPCECLFNTLNDDGNCGCKFDSQCDDGQICCPDKFICEDEPADGSSGACGDPHMTGFHGQKFDFTGKDGSWYTLVSDPPSMQINMRITAPVATVPEITYITGISIITTDADGFEHSVVISVKEPHKLESDCPAGVSPCLADGSLHVVVDGEEALSAPGHAVLAPGVEITAVNIPGECRSFGFETYWERKKLEYAQVGRRMAEAMDIGEWVLADPTATNMVECTEYVSRAMMQNGGLFDHQSEHASFKIITPATIIRLSHGRLHQLAMRDPTDQFDLPDHLTWQMNVAIDHADVSPDAQGILGETVVPTRDANGGAIMHGMESIRGQQEDYAVAGPLGVNFALDT